MSVFDYSKWDNIDDSEEEAEARPAQNATATKTSSQSSPAPPPGLPSDAKLIDPNNIPPEISADPALMAQLREQGIGGDGGDMCGGGGGPAKIQMTPKGSEQGRHTFEFQGQPVYEWDQTLDECNIWIKPPPGVMAAHLDIEITHTHVRVGIKGNPPFLNEDTGGAVVVKESFWTMDGDEVNINFQKMKKGEMWMSALAGHGELDPLTKEDDKKRLMLERFSDENPGFDFSNADFNGQIPEARNFMGGVKYN
mmetsp:Transcript_58202/g.116984  ORF Transcript_58202/g.116984 Transcript_58202/m.116984 type:complete len:252 (+) Transcript_58202:44-799(+)